MFVCCCCGCLSLVDCWVLFLFMVVCLFMVGLCVGVCCVLCVLGCLFVCLTCYGLFVLRVCWFLFIYVCMIVV